MAGKDNRYEEVSEENVKQIQVEENQKIQQKGRIPDQQNRMKSVENRRT